MMVVLKVFTEWYEAARGHTRTTETVVFCDMMMGKRAGVGFEGGAGTMERNGRNQE